MDARSLDELLLSTERRESDNLIHSNTCEQGLPSHSGGADPFATAFDRGTPSAIGCLGGATP